MEEKKIDYKKNIKIMSILFIILGAWDLLIAGVGYFTGIVNEVENIDLGFELDPSAIKIILYSSLITLTILALIKIIIGIRGFHQIKKDPNTKSHIVLLWILLVCNCIGLLSEIINIFSGNFNGSSFITVVADLLLDIYFIHYAKKYKKLQTKED